jgi:hypothetical protein
VLKPATIDIPPGTKKRLFRRDDLRFAVDGPLRQLVAPMTAEGAAMSPGKWDLLEKLGREAGDRGVTPLRGVYAGGLMASLRAIGVLEHAPELKGDLGDRRFRVSEAGRMLLDAAGRG